MEIKQSSEGYHHVPGVVEAKVDNICDVWNVLQTGSNAGAIGSNNVNEQSTRSHCLLRVTVVGESLINGHKLPVLCMDISSDEDLIVTGSANKYKDLGFGFCAICSQDALCVGKDRVVKYGHADKFEQLLTLEGNHADIWCLAVSSRGDFIVTGSHDRSIRHWDRTEEQFFIEEAKLRGLKEKNQQRL
ncbi:hypothetical protein KIW84_030456 [Lathyrus oleraceus]|uniref:Kinesin motor domain-containing protein n=1 Tax=Pisum sativum TaxID=3888 RepID=A0A9D5AW87_PEA|nr:hypothetical protein KIW84_030456 [Pisum sativum]